MSFNNSLSSIIDSPLWFIITMIILVPILFLITKNIWISFLIPYVLLIIGETLIFRAVSIEPRLKLEFLWSYKEWSAYWLEIIANIIVFIPLGIMLYKFLGWKGILISFLFSIGIECVQLISHRGWFEFDDIFNNSLGSFIGGVLMILFNKRNRKTTERNYK